MILVIKQTIHIISSQTQASPNYIALKDYFTAGKMNFYEKLNIYIVEMSN